MVDPDSRENEFCKRKDDEENSLFLELLLCCSAYIFAQTFSPFVQIENFFPFRPRGILRSNCE